MIIMKSDATKEQVNRVVAEIKKYKLRADVSRGAFRTVIGLVGDERRIPFDHLAVLPGVKEAIRVEIPYKLISWDYSKSFEGVSEPRIIKCGNISIGNSEPVFIAGPCAVESKQQLFKIAASVKKAGANVLRGGVFKPRSSVHSFQGLGAEGSNEAEEALSWMQEAGQKYEMAVATEVRGESQVELIARYADILQIGARNMYDQDLITRVAKEGKPVLFKRHFGAGIEEFLSFAEYIAAEGNKNIILCERGIVPVGKGRSYTRYNLDLAAVPVIQKETYLPIVVDPSHATGRRDLIYSMSCAAVASGAAGVMVEVHYNPAEALVDAQQAITPDELKEIITTCRKIYKVVASRKPKVKISVK
jgi:3-deoxy-7-phosphoheptulonate synthase